MRNQSVSALRWAAILLILSAVALFVTQLVQFSRLRATFPAGLTIARVPVGGQTRQEAAQNLLKVYSYPVEMHYGDNVILLDPATVGFELNLESMLAEADRYRTDKPFWPAFWDYLWGRPQQAADIPLVASYSEARLRTYLQQEIQPRYDQPPTPAQPVVGTVNFQPGQPGSTLDVERAVISIDRALRSPSKRAVTFTLQQVSPSRPSLQNLQILLQQTLKVAGYDGLAGIYLLDLQTAQEIHFISQNGEDLPTSPDVAFTAASTIKIPIMVSVYRRIGETPDSETLKLLYEMIDKSGNDPADWLMEQIIDPDRGPLEVSKDMHALGLDNTFLGGYFYLGAPLLYKYQTPANQRTDVNTSPDLYNQTTVTDMAMLLEDLYQCDDNGGGAFAAVFPGEITQSECRDMISLLANNHIGVLLEAGAPEGTKIAHKHGWTTDSFGVIHTIGDAGIVYTPGGDYILSIFLYHPQQLLWDPASALVAQLSRAVYNYFNLPAP